MKNKASRRKFIRDIGLSSIAAGVIPASLLANDRSDHHPNLNVDEDPSPANNKN